MICSKCGKNNKDDARFCSGCGAELKTVILENEVQSEADINSEPRNIEQNTKKISDAVYQENTTVQMKSRKPIFLWIGITTVLVLAAILITVFVLSKSSDEDKYKDKLDLGRKYLLELDYDQAILCFKEAIKIDPKKKDAYLELADAYVLNGEPEKAIEILEDALDEVESERDKEEIEEKKKKIKEEEVVTTPTPEVTETPTSELTATPEPGATETPVATTEPTATLIPTATPVPEPTESPYKKAETGDIITFGSYEQDNDLSNGKEPIEWIVLSNDGGKLLLLSKYVLDCKPYNTEYTDITWEKCSLRNWLNSEFYNSAFNDTEKEKIINSYIENHDNPSSGKKGGNDTYDNIFLLSLEDVLNTKYGFSNSIDKDSARACEPTDYAISLGAYQYGEEGTEDDINYSNKTCMWWLRSPGSLQGFAARVDVEGKVYDYGYFVTNPVTVRPALYIDLNSSDEEAKPTTTPKPTELPYKNANIGDIITFGSYEQDNDLSNGKEPIEWIVLSNEGGKLLLLSKYALDCIPYNKERKEVTWETCTIRSWLNNEFYNSAFDATEKAVIINSYIENHDDSYFETDGGNDTYDYVFLLSIEDVQNTKYGFSNKYSDYDVARRCAATAYAKSQGVKTLADNNVAGDDFWKRFPTADGEPACAWWLRSPGLNWEFASYVAGAGWFGHGGINVDINEPALRPALYLNLNP